MGIVIVVLAAVLAALPGILASIARGKIRTVERIRPLRGLISRYDQAALRWSDWKEKRENVERFANHPCSYLLELGDKEREALNEAEVFARELLWKIQTSDELKCWWMNHKTSLISGGEPTQLLTDTPFPEPGDSYLVYMTRA